MPADTPRRDGGTLLCVAAATVIAACTLTGPAFSADMFDANSPWMFGDWNGQRNDLAQRGYDFKLDYVGEAGANLHGG